MPTKLDDGVVELIHDMVEAGVSLETFMQSYAKESALSGHPLPETAQKLQHLRDYWRQATICSRVRKACVPFPFGPPQSSPSELDPMPLSTIPASNTVATPKRRKKNADT